MATTQEQPPYVHQTDFERRSAEFDRRFTHLDDGLRDLRHDVKALEQGQNAIEHRLTGIEQEQKTLSQRFTDFKESSNQRFDDFKENMDRRFESLERRMFWGFSILGGLIVTLFGILIARGG